MAQRVRKHKKREYLFFALTIAIFLLLANKYIINGLKAQFDFNEVFEDIKIKTHNDDDHKKLFCGSEQVEIIVEGGNLCREDIDQKDINSYKWLNIYDTYPKSAKGRELIYNFLDEGDTDVANKYIENIIDIERFSPVEIEEITWEEDPFDERYWRFIFYSLRDTRHLLYSYRESHDDKYKKKLITMIESFIDSGIDKPHAWDDYHAVAFRSMTLTNVWWKLRESNDLSVDLSEKILSALKRHGTFLAEDSHYEMKYNHGISQAAALLLLGVNFPEIDESGQWLKIAKKRVSEGIEILVDEDGILIENSPYYHFYALEKYWVLHKYSVHNGIDLGPSFKEKVDKMVSYATYILQPNLKVPILGASLGRRLGFDGVFKDIAKENPEFLYVLTQGRRGVEPRELNKYYPTTGQVIMRSGWGRKSKFENEFEDQTQIIFDVGPYRTDHSDLDALNFSLYSNGKALINDTGLYTYEEDNELKKYFHGTRGHNTVLVDGRDQRSGTPTPGKFVQGDGYALYSAEHSLYPQTYHQRGIVLLKHDAVLIIDRLISAEEHDYEQIFHLSPGSKTRKDGNLLIVENEGDKKELTIKQILSDNLVMDLPGKEEDEKNLCSFEYEKTVFCQEVSFKKHAKEASFITLLKIGDSKRDISVEIKEGNKVEVYDREKVYEIDLNSPERAFFQQLQPKEVVKEALLKLTSESGEWELLGEGSKNFKLEIDDKKKLVLIPAKLTKEEEASELHSYTADIDDIGIYYSVNQEISLDIPSDKESINYRVYEQEDFLPILGYHHILSDNDEIKSPKLEMHVSDFEKQVAHMTNVAGCRWFTFGDIMENYVLKGLKTPKRACVMNFDDGRKDHFVNGYETFRKYGAVATFYIITNRTFNDNSDYMNLTDLDELYRNGNEIGSHTVSASSLLTDGYDKDELKYQIEESKRLLKGQGYDVKTFAYPRGEQDEDIVNLTSDFYLAGRDTEKDNIWRSRRSATTSFDDEFIWHMHYHKPELQTPEELENTIGYDTWWQFEEGYRIDRNKNDTIRVLSSYKPTDSSYAIVDLGDVGNQISNKFIVSKDDRYNIEIYGVVNKDDITQYSSEGMIDLSIDGVSQKLKSGSGSECQLHKGKYYCPYETFVDLEEGQHIISVKAKQMGVYIDKFRMYRNVPMKSSYDIKITENKRSLESNNPDRINLDIESHYSKFMRILFYCASVSVIIVVSFLFLKLKFKSKK